MNDLYWILIIALAGLARNDTLAIDGRNWRAVSQPLANGHGLSQVYLEAL